MPDKFYRDSGNIWNVENSHSKNAQPHVIWFDSFERNQYIGAANDLFITDRFFISLSVRDRHELLYG